MFICVLKKTKVLKFANCYCYTSLLQLRNPKRLTSELIPQQHNKTKELLSYNSNHFIFLITVFYFISNSTTQSNKISRSAVFCLQQPLN